MKKMIISIAIMLVAVLSQAAAVNWSIDLGKANYAGKSYYVFAGGDSATVLESLGAFDASTVPNNLSDLALISGSLNTKAGKAGSTALEVGSNTSLFMVVLNDTLEIGKTYIYGTMDISDNVFTPPDTAPGTFVAQSGSFTGTGTITGVPEPTSGLLLLVGASLLALRRKQK